MDLDTPTDLPSSESDAPDEVAAPVDWYARQSWDEYERLYRAWDEEDGD